MPLKSYEIVARVASFEGRTHASRLYELNR